MGISFPGCCDTPPATQCCLRERISHTFRVVTGLGFCLLFWHIDGTVQGGYDLVKDQVYAFVISKSFGKRATCFFPSLFGSDGLFLLLLPLAHSSAAETPDFCLPPDSFASVLIFVTGLLREKVGSDHYCVQLGEFLFPLVVGRLGISASLLCFWCKALRLIHLAGYGSIFF